jgi:hypothetical protein
MGKNPLTLLKSMCNMVFISDINSSLIELFMRQDLPLILQMEDIHAIIRTDALKDKL